MKTEHQKSKLKRVISVLMGVWSSYQSQHIGLIAAGVAFYGFLSIFPAITALVAVAGLLTDPAILIEHGADIATTFPNEARNIIFFQLEKVIESDVETLSVTVIAGLLIAFILASKSVASLVQGLNAAYGMRDTRGFVALQARTLLLTICLIIGVLATLVLVAALPAILAFLIVDISLGSSLLVARWIVLFVLAALSMTALYQFGPDRTRTGWRWYTPGSVLAAALWLLGNYGFSFFVQSFGRYGEVFGALGGVMVLLTWLWLSVVVLLLGALVDVGIEVERGRT